MPLTHSTALRLGLGALLLVAAVAPEAAAQRTSGRNLRIAFEPGGPTRNGYMDAQVEVTYYFGRCADRVAFLAHYNATPHMLVGNHRYWVDGRQVEVPPHIAPPRIEAPTIRGTVRGNGIAKEITYLYASSGQPGCLTNDVSFGMTSEFWPANTPEDRRLAILNGFGFDQRGTLPPLRNSAVESHFRQVFAAERADSAAKARAAEQQRQVARRDSIQRAQAARARQDSIARAEQQRRSSSGAAGGSAAGGAGGTAAGTATAGGTMASSSSGGGGSAAGSQPSDPAAAERAAAEEAARERAEAEARAAAAVEEVRRRQEAEAERQRQIEAAAVATATAAVVIIGGIIEARREAVERRKAREAQRRREAEARYAAYVAATRARFEALPPQPACTLADVRDTVRLGMRTQTRTVTLAGDECRLDGGQSAELIRLELDTDAPVVLTPSSSPVLNQLLILDATTGRGVTSASEFGIATNLKKGSYVLVASSRLPGEVGDIKLDLRKGWVSDAQGSLGGAGASSQTINGFVGTNTTSTAWMDLHYGVQFRHWGPYLTFNLMVPTDTEAMEAYGDVGLRQYFLPGSARIRPFVEASLGYREIAVRGEPFTTISPAFGGGLTWRFSDGYGVVLSALQLTGEAKNTDDIWTSPPPPVPLGRTVVRMGLMIF